MDHYQCNGDAISLLYRNWRTVNASYTPLYRLTLKGISLLKCLRSICYRIVSFMCFIRENMTTNWKQQTRDCMNGGQSMNNLMMKRSLYRVSWREWVTHIWTY